MNQIEDNDVINLQGLDTDYDTDSDTDYDTDYDTYEDDDFYVFGGLAIIFLEYLIEEFDNNTNIDPPEAICAEDNAIYVDDLCINSADYV